MKRIGIFCFYNKNGIAGKYVIHLLSEMAKYYSELIIVCNGTLNDEGHKAFSKFSDRVYFRENEGYDAAAFKFIILEKIGKEGLTSYDELLIFNDTFYGPFFSMDHIFEKMNKENCDFWGLTSHNSVESDGIPYHIQSYFVNFKSRLLRSDCFLEFWDSLEVSWPDITTCIRNYEMRMTSYFENNGFVSSSFVKNDYPLNFYIDFPYEVIARYRLPIIKKRVFLLPIDSFQNYQIQKAYNHIADNYTFDYIFEDLLSSVSINTLKLRLGLFITVKPCKVGEDHYKIFGDIGDSRLDIYKTESIDTVNPGDVVLVFLPEIYGLDEREIALLRENLCYDEQYISGVLEIFKNRAEAGCLLPELIRTENRLSRMSAYYNNHGCFWIRGELLKTLLRSAGSPEAIARYSGEELAEKIGEEGFITYSLVNEVYAGMTSGIQQYYLSELINSLYRNHDFNDLSEAVDAIVNDRMHYKRIKKILKDRIAGNN